MFVSLPFRGHASQMIVLAQELLGRGYQVSFALSEDTRDWVNNTGVIFHPWDPNLEASDLKKNYSSDSIWYQASQEQSVWRGEKMMLEEMTASYVSMYKTLKPIFSEHKPDLIVVDRAVTAAMDLSWQMKIPCIIQSRFLGNFVQTPSNLPGYGTSYSIKMNRWEKIINRLRQLWILPQFLPALKKLNQVRKDCCGCQNLPDHFSQNLIIAGTYFGIEIPRPIPPLVKMVGPIFPQKIEPISPSLKEWLEAGEEDTVVIYIAFGTLVTLEPWQAKALVEGLTHPQYRVLWSIPKPQQCCLPPLPPSFQIESFVPQQAVLSHPTIRVFVSHCGMNSINESLYFGKPILALPFLGDQYYNAARLLDLGVALKLNKKTIKSDEVRQKVDLLVKNPSYTDKANKMSAILKRTRGRELAADIIETTLDVGISHLVPELIYE